MNVTLALLRKFDTEGLLLKFCEDQHARSSRALQLTSAIIPMSPGIIVEGMRGSGKKIDRNII